LYYHGNIWILIRLLITISYVNILKVTN
jgi:hypothetical protein